MSEILHFVEVTVRQAGAVLMAGFGNVRHFRKKGVIDLVTEFDKRSEEVIISSIQQKFPEHAILAEESGIHSCGRHPLIENAVLPCSR